MTNFPELQKNIEEFHNAMAERIEIIASDHNIHKSTIQPILELNQELKGYGLEVLTATNPKMGMPPDSFRNVQAVIMQLPEENSARQELNKVLDKLLQANRGYIATNRFAVHLAKEDTQLLSSDDLGDLEPDQ